MARQRLGEKTVARYAKLLGLDNVVGGLVRGGTNHRVDLLIADGSVLYYWPNTGETEPSGIGWDPRLVDPLKSASTPLVRRPSSETASDGS